MNKTIKFQGFTILFLMLLISFSSNAQKGKLKVHKRYMEASTLYLLDNYMNTTSFTGSSGEEINFKTLVENAWPDKKIELISKDDYLSLGGSEGIFHITLFKRTIEVGSTNTAMSTVTSEQYGIMIKEGGIELGNGKVLTFIWTDFEGIESGVHSERLAYGVNGLRLIMERFQEEPHSSSGIHQVNGFEEELAQKTLLLKESKLSKGLLKEGKLESLYKYKFEIVSDEEWSSAISSKRKDCVFIDFAQGGRFNSANVFTTDEGKLLITSYPWTGHQYKMDKTFFKDALGM